MRKPVMKLGFSVEWEITQAKVKALVKAGWVVEVSLVKGDGVYQRVDVWKWEAVRKAGK